VRGEAGQPGVQGEVRRQRVLGLQAEQVLGHRQRIEVDPRKQVLAGQQGPVQRTRGEPGHRTVISLVSCQSGAPSPDASVSCTTSV
jgi:hypothetical protein